MDQEQSLGPLEMAIITASELPWMPMTSGTCACPGKTASSRDEGQGWVLWLADAGVCEQPEAPYAVNPSCWLLSLSLSHLPLTPT
jgi:hypothetical protein